MSEGTERRLAAIVSTDVVGYSRLMGVDETGTLTAMRAHRGEHWNPTIEKFGGRVVGTAGDSLLVEFASAVAAVESSIVVQRAMVERNADLPDDQRMLLRIGINIGDVIIVGDDIFGDGVNIAARMQEIAAPGGIAISGNIHEQIDGKVEDIFADDGLHEVKNIARPVAVWRWSAAESPATAQSTNKPLPLPDKPSIAVLPFVNMSGDPEQEYFADGITEDIITEISRNSGLLVISRNSTFTYKNKASKAQDVCRDLGVRYLMEGSVRKSGERVRITAQLIDGISGGHLWAERYDRDLADIFAVQDDVTAQIVDALEVKLVEGANSALARVETDIPEAYDCVLRGREQYRLFSKDSNAAARDLYERAIVLDPDYGEPYAGLAETYVQEWFMGAEPTLDRAYELAQQAAARNPILPLVQEALSTVHLFKRQHAEAIATARRWIALEPSNADAYATLAGSMHFSGENGEVIALIDKAMRLDPFYPFFYPHYIGLANLAMRRFDEAGVAFKRAIARNPEALWPHVFLAACHGHLADDSQAFEQLAEVRRINPEFSIASLMNLLPYKKSADTDLVVDGLHKAGLSA